jgi:hypothetical protein
MATEILFSEWFWSEASARRAAARLEKLGYKTTVRYAMAADGRHDWLVEAA